VRASTGLVVVAALVGSTVPFALATPTAFALTTPTVTSTASASVPAGGAVSDSATVAGGSSPTGSITFDLFGPTDSTCSAVPIFTATVTVDGNGGYTSASFNASVAGTYHWEDTYSGDSANDGVGPSSCTATGESVVVTGTTPSPPLGPSAQGGDTTISLSWSGPSSNGGLAITDYDIFCSPANPVPTAGAPSASVGGSTTTVVVNGLSNGTAYHCVVTASNAVGRSGPSTTVSAAPAAPPHGYWLVGSDGGIFTFGAAQFHGSTGALKLQRPVVGITPTGDRGGYWLVASDGGIFAFGDAPFYGSIPHLGLGPAGSTSPGPHLNAPIVAMVPSADNGGYFMVASDGGVFAFGDATFAGSCPGIGGCLGAAVAVMPDASGNGYWLVTDLGHVYAFGDAAYLGAPGQQDSPVVSAARTADGDGYWILLADGAVFAYGDADNLGGPVRSVSVANPASAIFATADRGGYWVASAGGSVYPYGDAPDDGSMAGTALNGAIIAAAGF
jgi:hypothetical protein